MNPFIKSTVVCPICETKHTYQRLKAHVFSEQNPDVDLRPAIIKWSVKELKGSHPSMYYMWHCPTCHFTAGHPFFKNPVQGCKIGMSKFKKTIKTFYGTNENIKKVIDILSADINEKPDFYQALKLHLLAAFHLQLIDEIVKMDALNLGRYFLRTAWLYNDIKDYGVEDTLQVKIKLLIQSIKEYWPDVPENEKTALEIAVQYYMTALVGSLAIKTTPDEVNLVLLIARLYMKLGNIPEARKFIEIGKEKIRNSAQNLKSGDASKLSDEKKSKLALENNKMRLLIDDVQNIFEDIWQEWKEKQIQKGKEIIKQHTGKSSDRLRAILIEQGIDQRIALQLAPKHKKKKKKKLFGLF
ncbi:putative DUF2225 domain-containing protein [Candidatus Magnetomoraceae bacterium gMMP-15]